MGRERVLKQLQFNGEVVVVTGAGTGIGRATAEALAELGATIVLVGRTQSKIDEVKAAIEKSGGKAEAFAADVSKEADVARLRDFVKGKWGRAKAIVNNAGNNFISPITELVDREMARADRGRPRQRLLHVPRLHPAAAAERRTRRSSTSPRPSRHIGNPQMPVYCAAKGGVVSLTRQLAVDYGAEGAAGEFDLSRARRCRRA